MTCMSTSLLLLRPRWFSNDSAESAISVQRLLDPQRFDAAALEKVLHGSNVHERVTTLAGTVASHAEVASVLEAAAGLH